MGKNKCGVAGFSCGVCARCIKKEDERWQQIWDRKYSQQMERYYNRDRSYLQETQSFTQSSLNTNLPTNEDVYGIALPREASLIRRAADGLKHKLNRLKRKALYPA